MVNLHLLLYGLAIVLFVLAGCPTGWRVRLEWWACAALVLAQVV